MEQATDATAQASLPLRLVGEAHRRTNHQPAKPKGFLPASALSMGIGLVECSSRPSHETGGVAVFQGVLL